MMTNNPRQRLRELRELSPPRTAAQEAELASLVQELQIAESVHLAEAIQRLQQELKRGNIDPKLLEELGWTERDGLKPEQLVKQ